MPRSDPAGRDVVRQTTEYPTDIHEAIRAHAYLRNVSMAKLRLDILRGWLIAATDWNRPFFKELPHRVAPIRAPYPSYIESLGFAGEGPAPDAGDFPVRKPPAHLDAAPEAPEDLAFTQLGRIDRL